MSRLSHFGVDLPGSTLDLPLDLPLGLPLDLPLDAFGIFPWAHPEKFFSASLHGLGTGGLVGR